MVFFLLLFVKDRLTLTLSKSFYLLLQWWWFSFSLPYFPFCNLTTILMVMVHSPLKRDGRRFLFFQKCNKFTSFTVPLFLSQPSNFLHFYSIFALPIIFMDFMHFYFILCIFVENCKKYGSCKLQLCHKFFGKKHLSLKTVEVQCLDMPLISIDSIGISNFSISHSIN